MTPAKPGTWRGRDGTDSVPQQSARRPRTARLAPLTFAAGVAISLTSLVCGVALADPPPLPDPSPSDTVEEPAATPAGPSVAVAPAPAPAPMPLTLTLSTSRGIPGSSFTATVSDVGACDRLRTAVAGTTVAFQWRFDQQFTTADVGSVSATFTVPDAAAPDIYHVTASCAGLGSLTATADFTVVEKASVSLQPQQGIAGRTLVTATAKGFEACLRDGSSAAPTMSWQWDGQPLSISAGTDGSTVTFDVPITPAGGHTVTATCGATSVISPFTVVPITTPALTLDKPQGPRGSQLTASWTGFACGDDRVTVLWDGQTPVGDGPADTFSIPLTVPDDASVSQHTVAARCSTHPDVTDTQSFTVTKDAVGAVASAALTLTPTRGAPGASIYLTGDRFVCTDNRTVQLSWDGQPLTTLTADSSGHFETSIAIPAEADVNSHVVRAACEAGSAATTAGFTVLAAGTLPPAITTTTTASPPPPPPDNSGAAIALLMLIIVGVSAVLAHRHWRKRRLNPVRVHATISPTSGLPVVSTSDTPADGEVSHALRLLVHADLGTQTISEVNSDHTTP